MPSKIRPFYPIYNDVDGDPLDAGYIYIGTENLNPEIEANQLAVYFDRALIGAESNTVGLSFTATTPGS